MKKTNFTIVSFLLGRALSATPETTVYATILPGENDRHYVRLSSELIVKGISLCEPNVRWGCESAQAKYRPVPIEQEANNRRWFHTKETILLWDKKKIFLKLQTASGTRRQVIQFIQKKQVFGGDLTNPNVGDAQPNPILAGLPCVFAYTPLPIPNANGERGTTYPTHRTSRDYWVPDETPLYSMGTCETVKRIDTGIEHPCGFGIAMRCLLNEKVMGLLYCHLSKPARQKKFFGLGELVGYSGRSGTDNPHLHIGLTFDVHSVPQPHPQGLEDEELLMPGLPVPQNNPDKWFRENHCYLNPTMSEEERDRRPLSESNNGSIVRWDGISFLGNEVWDITLLGE